MQFPEMPGSVPDTSCGLMTNLFSMRCMHAAAAGKKRCPRVPTFWGAGPSFLPISGERRWKKGPLRVALPGGVPGWCASAALGVLSAACAFAHVCQRLMQ